MPASRPPPGSFEALLTDPYVVSAIDRRLTRYGFRPAGTPDLDDARQDVFTKAFAWAGERPTTKEGVARLCVCIAHKYGKGHYRKGKGREEKGYAGLTVAADEHPLPTDLLFDVIDFKRLCKALDETVPNHLADAFEDIFVGGMSQTEAFDKHGIPQKKGRKMLAKWRLRSPEALTAMGFGVLLVAGAAYLVFFRGLAVVPDQQQAHPTPSAPPTQVVVDTNPTGAPSGSAGVPATPEKLAQAAALRAKAFAAADAGAWDEVGTDLDQATILNPAGAEDEAVSKLQYEVDKRNVSKLTPLAPLKPSHAPGKSTKPAGSPR